MDIRVTSTGKVFYQVDNTVAAILVEALPSVFERANKPPEQSTPQTPTPEWGVGIHPVSNRLFVKLTVGSQTTFYFGPPKGLKSYSFGWPVPDAVVKEYERRYTVPTVSDLPAEYHEAMREK